MLQQNFGSDKGALLPVPPLFYWWICCQECWCLVWHWKLSCNMLLIEIENNVFENEQNFKWTSENKDLIYELFIWIWHNIISLFLSLFPLYFALLDEDSVMSDLPCSLYYLSTQELQELHSALEEAKADIVGLWALRFLISQVSSQW